MGKNLQSLLDEAEQIIGEKLAVKTAAPLDDVEKLAEELTETPSGDEMTLTEKVAYARALMDTVINLDYLKKVYDLEKKAEEAGIPGEKLSGFFEKKASTKFKSVTDLLDW